MTPVLSDTVLMELAFRGDVAAFASIYDRHAPLVLALLRRMLGGSSDAHDVLHDVFLEAWRSVRAYDAARGSVQAWLMVRARSRALDRLAYVARQSSFRLTPLMATHVQPSEQQLAVRQALAKLSPRLREALELTYFEGLSAPETSERMNVPEGTVRSRVHRGLDALKDMLLG